VKKNEEMYDVMLLMFIYKTNSSAMYYYLF